MEKESFVIEASGEFGSFRWELPSEKLIQTYQKYAREHEQGKEIAYAVFRTYQADIQESLTHFLTIFLCGLSYLPVVPAILAKVRLYNAYLADFLVKRGDESARDSKQWESDKSLSDVLSITSAGEFGSFSWEVPPEIMRAMQSVRRADPQLVISLKERVSAITSSYLMLICSAIASTSINFSATEKILDILSQSLSSAIKRTKPLICTGDSSI